MIDSFAILREERRPWLDPEPLRERFLALSGPLHPDRFHEATGGEREVAEARYSALNSAHLLLRDPRTRLLHLLELESGARPKDIQRIPPGTMDLFVEVGQTCRDVDAYLARRAAVASPMLRVRLFEEGLDWTDRLNVLQAKVNGKEARLGDELKAMNEVWARVPGETEDARRARLPLGRLEELYRVFSYVVRWTGQIQERAVSLASF